MRRKQLLVNEGDPDCVHREQIDSQLIGRCRCGLVKNYGDVPMRDIDPAGASVYGDATVSQVQTARSRGGQATKGIRSPKKGQPAGSGLVRDRYNPGRTGGGNGQNQGQRPLPALTKGVDF